MKVNEREAPAADRDVETAAAAPARTAEGILCVLVAVVFFCLMDAALKWLAARYSVAQIALVRNGVALSIVLGYICRRGSWRELRTRRLGAQLRRGVFAMGSLCLYTLALSTMKLADALAVAFTAPLFLTVLAVPLLGEKVGLQRATAVVVGFGGVLIICRPGAGVFGPGALYALTGAFCYALQLIFARKLSRTDTNNAIITYTLLTGVALPALGLALGPWTDLPALGWTPPVGVDRWVFLACGVLTVCAHFALTQAYRLTAVAVLAPFDYTAIVWASLLGYWIWGDLPDASVVAGVLVVMASGLYIFHRETVRGARNRGS